MSVSALARSPSREAVGGEHGLDGRDERVPVDHLAEEGDRASISPRYVAEYKKRAAARGVKGIESNAPPPGSPPAAVRDYHERLLPDSKKAGLP